MTTTLTHSLAAIHSLATMAKKLGYFPEEISDAMDSIAIVINSHCNDQFTRIYAGLRCSIVQNNPIPLISDWIDSALEKLEIQ